MTTDEKITPSSIPEILLDTTPDSKTNTITQIFTSKGPVLSMHTLDLKEPKLREALISLGWTPPKPEPEILPTSRFYPDSYMCIESDLVETINSMLRNLVKEYSSINLICGGFTVKYTEVSDPFQRFCTIYPIPVKLPTPKETP